MWRLTQAAVNGGTSLIIFPEAKRTRDGRVDQFQDGGFRVAQQLGIPIVPVSLVGSFQHHRTGHWMVWPAKIKVHLHDTIETKGMTKEDVPALRERVREIIAAPVEESLKQDCHRVTGALSGEQQRGPSVAKLPRDRNPS
jgi:1-acyl-sn-glycerol-3-phosphate acyltransferase